MVDTGTKLNKVPLQAADLLAFAILNGRDARFRDTLDEFGSNFPVVIEYITRSELEQMLHSLNEQEIDQRRQRRRFASVIRELKRTGADVERNEHGAYGVNFDDFAEAEKRLIGQLGNGRLSRFLRQGDAAKPPNIDTEIDLECVGCKALFTLRGGFLRRTSFECPICRVHTPFPAFEGAEGEDTIDQ